MLVEEVRHFLSSFLFLPIFLVKLFLVDHLDWMVVEVETLENKSLLLDKSFKLVLILKNSGIIEDLGDDVIIIYLCFTEQVLVGEDVGELVKFDKSIKEDMLVVVVDIGEEVTVEEVVVFGRQLQSRQIGIVDLQVHPHPFH